MLRFCRFLKKAPQKLLWLGFVLYPRIIFCAEASLMLSACPQIKKTAYVRVRRRPFLFVDYAVLCTAEIYATVCVVVQTCRGAFHMLPLKRADIESAPTGSCEDSM